jgi:hypothetical protein
MKNYEKPMIIANDELAEGVYAAPSGDDANGNAASGQNQIKCDSKYMEGNWQIATYASDPTLGYKYIYGCLGCRAYTPTGCGLLSHYVESNYASSYEEDEGRHKPAWEWLGHKPNDTVSYQDDCGNQVGSDLS